MTSNVFKVSGAITFETALALRKRGDRWIEKEKDILVNFQAVDQCNSAGLAVMTAWLRQAKRLNKSVRFIKIPSSLRVIAAVCGMTEILGIK
ncbi:hypothetical protein B1F79_01910 [Coxiella-like endosymbiont of Rhipicephalus sanguineus]|uniref:STAS domain-containing protein n=1 Tax=Coxiella-like endosymbiont of Rhipicephalus sanguineus TaxID=1955402 RepID=UPI002040546F|nr:STAS domain-containing protein [Coxiella-like endosymbiont of Rhipicephalus sanguineus]MBT8506413.1 hypothetical protein [Coxiella-like endosymbiont of Rhipicephalus sanguineus]